MKKFYLSRTFQTVLILLLLSFSTISYAQEKLFLEGTTLRQSDLNKQQLLKFENVKNNPLNKRVHLVNLLDKKALKEQGNLQINIPGTANTHIMKTTKVDLVSDNELVWYGDIEGETYGTAIIIAKDDAIYGHIQIEDDRYSLQNLGSKKTLLVHLDSKAFWKNICATKHGKPNSKPKPRATNYNTQRMNDVVRVLVLFTNNANNAGNPQNAANLYITQLNSILQNSAITPGQFHFQLAGVRLLAGFNDRTFSSSENLLNNLRGNANAQALRNQFQADLVVLLTDANFLSSLGRAFLDEAGDEAFGYAFSEIDAGGTVFSHEVGHLFGGRHQEQNDPRVEPFLSPFARPHNFRTGFLFTKRRKTIMSSGNSAGSFIQHFSNPNVTFKRKRTGVANERDNARQLRALAPTVAQYRDFTAPPNVNITGDFSITTGEYGGQTYTANTSGGASPYTYEWCLNGSCYSSGTNNTTNFTVYPNGNAYWQLKVTVTDANQSTRSQTKTIQIQQPYYRNMDKEEITELDNAETKDIKLIPNPASNYFSLSTSGLDYKEVSVLDFKGDVIKQFKRNDRYYIGNLPKGLYFIQIRHQKTHQILKLLKQ